MFSFRDKLQHQWFTGTADFAPVGSVFLLVLIFFLLQSHLAPVPGVPVELPMIESGLPAFGPDCQVVVVDREGRLFYRQQLITDAALVRQLSDFNTRPSEQALLVIQADRSLRLERLAEVYALCRQAGITHLKLQTRPAIGQPVFPPRQP